MKNLMLILFITSLLLGCKEKTEKPKQEMTADQVETTEGEKPPRDWTVLFDGTSFDGWREFQGDGVSDNWKIEDGAMVFHSPENRKDGEIHDLVTEKEFTNFVLSLDWKISEAGNSGVMWGVKEGTEFEKPYHTGPEIQVLDNEKHPDAKAGKTHQAGALYDMVAPSKDVTNPVGEWNTMVITVNNDEKTGSVELNGEEVVTFPVANAAWDAMVSTSKFADWDGFGKFKQGRIALQDHGNMVAYRNIKIKEL